MGLIFFIKKQKFIYDPNICQNTYCKKMFLKECLSNFELKSLRNDISLMNVARIFDVRMGSRA